MDCAGSGSTWAGDCRVMCMMEYLTPKKVSDPFFLEFAECRQSISASVFVFSTRRWDESHQGFVGWE